MTIKQISAFLENSPGHLRKVCKVLADARVNLRTITIAETANFGVLRAIVDDNAAAMQALAAAGIRAKEVEVLALPVDDCSGALLPLLEKIEQHSLNVEYMYAYTPGGSSLPVMIMKFSDLEKAKAVMTND